VQIAEIGEKFGSINGLASPGNANTFLYRTDNSLPAASIAMSNNAESKTPGPGKLPARYVQFQKRFPTVFQAYDALGAATAEAGPLDGKQRALVKLAIAIGGQMEGAVHSHTRRALEAGCSAEEIRHAVLLSTTTLGFPSMMKTLSWVDDVLTASK
jgi:4-carboxymuconolactone decarboxylase